MTEGNTMWVCTHEPACACAGYVEFDCQCEALHVVGETTGVCLYCAAPMVLIDNDTGARILYSCGTGDAGWR
jgi:hypothetical protein